MTEVIFSYEGTNTTIQCDENDTMKDIYNKFLIKIQKEDDNLYCIYNGNKINKELTFNEQVNTLDKDRKKMNIIVIDDNKTTIEKHEIISKDIICPECKDNIIMDIKNFKINLSGCNHHHNKYNIILYSFEETQKIDLNEIKCDICDNNKGNTHNNEFYRCNTCNKNICPLCKSVHDKNHIIINYDDKNYVCDKHNESFSKYCEDCKENICLVCEKKHNNHKLFDFKNVLVEKNELLDMMSDLKDVIDIFKYKINMIKEIFDQMINVMDIYYKFNENIINNYNINKRNYYNLKNTYNIKNNNEMLIKEMNDIFNNDKLSEISEFSINNFYDNNGEKYIGENKNGLKEGKGILYYDENDIYERKKYEEEKEKCILMMVIDMKVIIKMVKSKEKEYIFGMMVRDMKVVIKMVKLKEKE